MEYLYAFRDLWSLPSSTLCGILPVMYVAGSRGGGCVNVYIAWRFDKKLSSKYRREQVETVAMYYATERKTAESAWKFCTNFEGWL
jgi:hypothetical protein